MWVAFDVMNFNMLWFHYSTFLMYHVISPVVVFLILVAMTTS